MQVYQDCRFSVFPTFDHAEQQSPLNFKNSARFACTLITEGTIKRRHEPKSRSDYVSHTLSCFQSESGENLLQLRSRQLFNSKAHEVIVPLHITFVDCFYCNDGELCL